MTREALGIWLGLGLVLLIVCLLFEQAWHKRQVRQRRGMRAMGLYVSDPAYRLWVNGHEIKPWQDGEGR